MTAPLAGTGVGAGVGGRGSSWTLLLSALAAFLLVPSTPFVQTIAPVANTVVLLLPAIAVCTALGWAKGGPWWLALVWAALGVASIALLPGASQSRAFTTLERGWAIILVASFGLVSIASSEGTPFLTRALYAVALAWLLKNMVLVAVHTPSSAITQVVARELVDRPRVELPLLDTASDVVRAGIARTVGQVTAELPPLGTRLFPALLTLQSLGGLALAWAVYHRIARARIGPALGALRDFRFNDRLVWGLLAGVIFLAVPAFASARAFGLNLTTFFGTLYTVRGLGVVAAWLDAASIGTAAIVALIVLGCLLTIPAGVALGVIGLSDMMFNYRTHLSPARAA